MPDDIALKVNGVNVVLPNGATVAVAVMMAAAACRISVKGEPRAPLCGMGVCMECRVRINGIAHCRSCQILCESDMDVRTNE